MGETNSQFLALNSCKAHTSSISCSYLVCDTDYLLLCVGKFFFFHPTRTSFFFFLPMWVKFFFPSMCGSSFFFFFLPLSGSSFFFYKNFLLPPPLKSNGASLIRRLVPNNDQLAKFWSQWSQNNQCVSSTENAVHVVSIFCALSISISK